MDQATWLIITVGVIIGTGGSSQREQLPELESISAADDIDEKSVEVVTAINNPAEILVERLFNLETMTYVDVVSGGDSLIHEPGIGLLGFFIIYYGTVAVVVFIKLRWPHLFKLLVYLGRVSLVCRMIYMLVFMACGIGFGIFGVWFITKLTAAPLTSLVLIMLLLY